MATHADLTNGKIPRVGFGTWKVPNDVCAETVYMAIKNGYRHIDEALLYGNEKECGEGIKKAIDEGIVTRADLFITTKLWVHHMKKEHVALCLKKSLELLGLDYVDLYLIHFPIAIKYASLDGPALPDPWLQDPKKPEEGPVFEQTPISETWAGMEDLVTAGLAKNIGVSNFNCLMIRDILTYCKIKPCNLQIEIHPYLQ